MALNDALRDELSKIGESNSSELIHNQIRDVLQKFIITGTLEDGDRLVEDQIAKIAGVSRIPIREAFRALEAEGLIEIRPRRGARVIGITDDDITEVFRIRGALEQLACDYIIDTADDSVLEEGRSLLIAAEQSIKIEREYSSLNQSSSIRPVWNTKYSQMFNLWIMKACKRPRIESLYERYNRYISIFREVNSSDINRRSQALEEHIKILDALSARDKSAVHCAVRFHAEQSLNAFIQRRNLRPKDCKHTLENS